MDTVMKEIMILAKQGDLERVRHILKMNLKAKHKKKFYKKIVELPLRKKAIIQNLDMLNIFDIIEAQGYERFDLKFWEKAITYYIAIGDSYTLQRLGHDLTIAYGKDFIEHVVTTEFDSPIGTYKLKIAPYPNDVEVLEHLIMGINEAAQYLHPNTVAKYFGTVFTHDCIDISKLSEELIKEQAYWLVSMMAFHRSNIHRKLKGEPSRLAGDERQKNC